MGKPLDAGQRHILKLISRDRDADGRARVSKMLFPVFQKSLPAELVEFEQIEDGSGFAKLTSRGDEVVRSFEYLGGLPRASYNQ